MSSANWAGVTSRPCGWPGISSMMHSLLHILNILLFFCLGDIDYEPDATCHFLLANVTFSVVTE